jgi:protocatechuate 3,4-dioxygenase beta subunit
MRRLLSCATALLATTGSLVGLSLDHAAAAPSSSLKRVTPSLVLDTSRHVGAAGALAPGSTTVVKVTGLAGVPGSGVQAVLLDLAVSSPSRGAVSLSVTPHGFPIAGRAAVVVPASRTAPGSGTPSRTDQQLPHVTRHLLATVGDDGAVDVSVGTGSVAAVSATVSGYYLTRAGAASIAGRVVDTAGKPLRNVRVLVRTGDDFTPVGGDVLTRGDGTYSLPNLPDGQYHVCFDPNTATGGTSTTGYVPECFDDQPFPFAGQDGGDAVTVRSGSTARADATLQPGAAVTGKVADAAGHPLANAQVFAFWDGVGMVEGRPVSTAKDGTYKLLGLDPAVTPTLVCFEGANARGGTSTTGYQETCSSPLALASGVAVKAGTQVLVAGAAISGTVTDALGHPLANASVFLGGSLLGPVVAPTAADGSYLAKGLSGSQQMACFDGAQATGGGSDQQGYVAQCWGNRPWWDPAYVDVTPGTTTTGIEAQLALGAEITGHVTDAAGHALALALVNADVFDADFNGIGVSAWTDGLGGYRLRNLPSGTATACFDGTSATSAAPSPYGYVAQCYDGAPDYPTATRFTLTGGQTQAAVDAALVAGGAVAGTVLSTAGEPLSFVGVTASTGGNPVGWGQTDATGSYVVTGLPAGSFSVCFQGTYATDPEGVVGYSSSCAAAPVDVASGSLTPGVDATLQVAGVLTGTVTSAAGDPLSGVAVWASAPDGSANGFASTADDGTYRLTGLPDGQYSVCFYADYAYGGTAPEGYVDECFDDAAVGTSDATLVTVTSGTETSGVDASLADGGAISGTVRDASGNPVESSVTIWDGTTTTSAYAGSDGAYSVQGLAPGSYTVCAWAAQGYGYGCYGGTSDPNAATPVTVVADSRTSSVDITVS